MKARQFAGLALLLGVIGAILVFSLRPDPEPPGPEPVVVRGHGGGKGPFLENPQVEAYLRDTYGLTIDFTRTGSIEQLQVCGTEEGLDFCWPSSQTVGELIEQKPGIRILKSEVIFNSPIVIYTWTPIIDVLIAQGIVDQSGSTYYVVDLAKLVDLDMNGVRWSAIGLPALSGTVQIRTSDPTASNTGNSFAGLLANTLNEGRVVDESTVENVIPQLQEFFNGRGLMPDTTTEMWEQFFTLGMGASPFAVAYESNLIEYCLQNSSDTSRAFIRDNVRTLYPAPTVWSSQPMIAFTEAGERLVQALRDPVIQQIGWEQHGFRTAVPGVSNNTDICTIPGVPSSIDSVIPMPNPATMNRIIEALGGQPVAAIRRREDVV